MPLTSFKTNGAYLKANLWMRFSSLIYAKIKINLYNTESDEDYFSR
jgi:hypothetical protein